MDDDTADIKHEQSEAGKDQIKSKQKSTLVLTHLLFTLLVATVEGKPAASSSITDQSRKMHISWLSLAPYLTVGILHPIVPHDKKDDDVEMKDQDHPKTGQ